jgi:hypothetical protein
LLDIQQKRIRRSIAGYPAKAYPGRAFAEEEAKTQALDCSPLE